MRDSKVSAAIVMGASDVSITGGQLTLSYDPAILDFLDVQPGRACDSASPFAVELLQNVDEVAGKIEYGVSVSLGKQGTPGPASLACVTFLVIGNAGSDLCLLTSGRGTFLVDDAGRFVPAGSGENCPRLPPPEIITCAQVETHALCPCGRGAPDCSVWDSACSVGRCDEVAARCVGMPINEGGPCDDGDTCTLTDRCAGGLCVGHDCANPSLCVSAEPACAATSEGLVRIVLGEGDPVIVGGQFRLRFDPALLNLVRIEPGVRCDPTSPFVLEIFESVDEQTGDVFYAVGVSPIYYSLGADSSARTNAASRGPTTMACLTFGVSEASAASVCIRNGEHPFRTLLVDDLGQAVAVHNQEECPADPGAGALSCDVLEVEEECSCTTDLDCRPLDTECRTSVCDQQIGRCRRVPANEGEPCDDGDPCTSSETCQSGQCVDPQCTNPSLCVEADEECLAPGSAVGIAIQLGQGSPLIVGGQFSIRYDTDALDLISIEPGNRCDPRSPFSMEIYESVDEESGRIFYATGVGFGEPGTTGPAAMACLRFLVQGAFSDEICVFNDMNPFSTILVTQTGQAAGINNALDCPGTSLPVMSCDAICVPVPVVTEWSLVHITLLILVIAKVGFRRRRRTEITRNPKQVSTAPRPNPTANKVA